MLNFSLYAATALLWGTTWLPITLHFGVVAPEVSLAYRSWIAAAVLFVWCALRGLTLRYDRHAHFSFAVQGFFLFNLNYLLLYLGQARLTSGLVAIIFSLLSMMNTATGALLLKRPIEGRMVFAGLLGAGGLALTFAEDLAQFDVAQLAGVGLALAGTLAASLGNIMSARNQQIGLPIVQANAFGMAYGAGFTTLYCLAVGATFNFDPTFRYVGSLLYLAVFGSVIGFGCYLTLLGRVGAPRAAYISVLFPIVALTLSTWFEDYRWTLNAGLGIGLVLTGNLLVLLPRRPRQQTLVAASGGGS
ncbi:MAG: DMT family transporter [Alphaproteobacteria bacterium]|nr:DMT family transporter [Alphaproteobacteria bacterium]